MDLFVFRRDLRTVDNSALSELSPPIAYAFVADARQTDPDVNPYHSAPAARFMAESLADLEHSIGRQLHVFRTHAEMLDYSGWHHRIRRVAFNADHTPFARTRDAELVGECRARGIPVVSRDDDYSLVTPGRMPKPYLVFSPFFARYGPEAAARAVGGAASASAATPGHANIGGRRLAELCALLGGVATRARVPRGGRRHALAVLAQVRDGGFDDYGDSRDDMGANGGEGATTRLSAYIKFGCVSVREVAAAALSRGPVLNPLFRELMFRSFYDQVAFHCPWVLRGEPQQRARERSVRWRSGARADADFDAWTRGITGVPLVDAGMRQLEATGFMHNRARMVTASYLVKDLLIDWRRGERHFATRLVDYDPSANSGGWQWVAGCGAGAMQFSRVFNPWRQAQRFDAQGAYVRRWVHELRDASVDQLLRPDADRPGPYPRRPIVDRAAAMRRLRDAARLMQRS